MDCKHNYIDIGTIDNIEELKIAVSKCNFKRRSLRDTMTGTVHYDTRVDVGLFDIIRGVDGAINVDTMNRLFPLVVDSIKKVEKHYKYEYSILKSLIAINLLSGGRIDKHKDDEDFNGDRNDGIYNLCHRIHLVIDTNDKVLFNIDGEVKHLEVGSIVEVNNIKPHYVVNNGFTNRIHIVMDIIGIKQRYDTNTSCIPDNFYL